MILCRYFQCLKDWQISFGSKFILSGHPIGHIRILGIGLELACNGGSCQGISQQETMSFTFEKIPRISARLSCKLVPVLYREYEYGLLNAFYSTFFKLTLLSLRKPQWTRKMQSLSGEYIRNSIYYECLPEALHPICLLSRQLRCSEGNSRQLHGGYRPRSIKEGDSYLDDRF